jgi:hypothetical protein
MIETHNASLAQILAKGGLAVFPCGADKKPVFGCKWRDASTTDPLSIETLWRDNPDAPPAIDCGKSGLAVVDVDNHEGGENGCAKFAEMECENGSIDFAPRITTPSGGYHVYFAQPEDGGPIGNGTGDLPKGIDVRGVGGYVLAAGAVMPDGRKYTPQPASPRLSDVLANGGLAPLDGWLLDLIRPAPSQQEKTAPPRRETNGDCSAYANAAFDNECGSVANAGKGGRNEQLNKSAFNLGTLIGAGLLGEAEVEASLLAAAKQCGLTNGEARATVKSGMKNGKDHPRQRPDDNRRGNGQDCKGDDAEKHRSQPLEPPAPIAFKTAARFCGEYVPLAYTIEPILRSASLYTLTAKTGAGKTAFNVIAALAVATGRADILNREVVKGRVAYLACENPDDIRMRIKIAAYLLSINLDDIGDDLLILDYRAKPEAVHVELKRLAKQRPFALVIVDTLAAFFDGDDINNAVQGGQFMRRLRPLTQIAGLPTVLVSAHPVKNACEDALIPYGSGAILNEVDGNLTLWKRPDTGTVSLHWQGKLRGLEFQAVQFRFEEAASPEILDAKGREVRLPTMRPSSEQTSDDKQASEADRDRALLAAMVECPGATIRHYAGITGVAQTNITRKLQRLAKAKLVEQVLDKWTVTAKGRKAVATPGTEPPATPRETYVFTGTRKSPENQGSVPGVEQEKSGTETGTEPPATPRETYVPPGTELVEQDQCLSPCSTPSLSKRGWTGTGGTETEVEGGFSFIEDRADDWQEEAL